MVAITVTLDLPAELTERTERIALDANLPLEVILAEGLNLFFSAHPFTEIPQLLNELSTIQLWILAVQLAEQMQDTRFDSLVSAAKEASLTAADEQELQQRQVQLDQLILLRSRVLVLLQQRGQAVEAYLKSTP
ncbi:MAG: hypothetical protein ACOYL5_04145 [Phototrophicaceae bacterium]|jgi:hypothetical protein